VDRYQIQPAAPTEGGLVALPQKPMAPSFELDDRHRSALSEIVRRPSWSKAELRSLTTQLGLMPFACLERLNLWALEKFGEPMLEGEETVVLNINLKKQLKL
jgi:hypothetical protein